MGYLLGWEKLILSFYRMTRKILSALKVSRFIKKYITQAVFPILFICPVLCNSKYEAIY